MNSKELNELIHQNTRIILPEFGAFLVKDSGEKGFNPANVSFSPFLRYNDGMLEVYVAKSRGISKESAAKDVQEYVETIKNELLEKGAYEVEGLGFLKRDQRGSLSFSVYQPDEKKKQADKAVPESSTSRENVAINANLSSENIDDKKDVGLEDDKTVEAVKSKEKKTRKVAGSKTKVEKLAATKKITKATYEIDETQQEQIHENNPEPVVESKPEPKQEVFLVDKLIADTKDKQLIAEKLERKVIQGEAKGDKHVEDEKPISPKIEVKKKRGYIGLLFTGIAIAIMVALFFAIRSYYFPPNVEIFDGNLSIKKTINAEIEAKDNIEKPKDDIDKAFNELSNGEKGNQTEAKEQLKKEEEQEETIKNSLIKNAQTPNTKIIKTTGIKFYIIAGSFKNPDFAEKFLNELNRSGYKASIVIQPSGMNAVTIGGYNTREEANESMKSYKSKFPNLWILKK